MKTNDKLSSEYSIRSSYVQNLLQGGKLSILVSVLASLLFLVIFPLFRFLSGAKFASEDLLNDRIAYLILFFGGYLILGFLAIFLLILIPAILGGLSNTIILSALIKANSLTVIKGIVIGAIIGGIWGYFTAYIGGILMINLVIDVYPGEKEIQVFKEIMTSGILVAIVAGIWHGWQMTRCLTLPRIQ